jgi:hypothetical protein
MRTAAITSFQIVWVAHLKAVPAGVRYGHAGSTDENPTIAFDLSKQMER